MARTLNRVQLIGRLGADPEVRIMAADMTVAQFSLATNRQWRGKDGEMQEETDWHNIVAWDRLAQICAEHLSKGRLVYVEGRLRTRSWETNGQKNYKTEIVASDMLLLDTKSGPTPQAEPVMAMAGTAPRASQQRTPKKAAVQVADDFDDPRDLPF